MATAGVCYVDAEQCHIQACGAGIGQTGSGGGEE
jgi:hypothetical protein